MNTRAATTSEPTPKAFGAALFCVTCRTLLRVGDSAPMRAWAETNLRSAYCLPCFVDLIITEKAEPDQ